MARTRAFTTTSRHARGVRPPRSPSCGESYVVKALGWRYGPNAVSSAFTSPDGGGYALGDAQALRRTETANTGSSLATRAGLEWFRWIMGVPPPEDGCAVRWTSGGTELIVIARPTRVTDAPVHVAMGDGGSRTRLVASDTDGSSWGMPRQGLSPPETSQPYAGHRDARSSQKASVGWRCSQAFATSINVRIGPR